MAYGDCSAAVAYIDRIAANCTALANGESPASISPDMKQDAIDGLKNMLRNVTGGAFEMQLKHGYAYCHKDLISKAVSTVVLSSGDITKELATAQSDFARNKGKTAKALKGKIAEVSAGCTDVTAGIASVMNDA